MVKPVNNPEPAPEEEKLKIISKKKAPKKLVNKCLACNDGLVYSRSGPVACKGCKGKGYIS